MNITIRSSELKDFPAVFNLFKQLWPTKPLNETDLNTVYVNGLSSGSDVFISALINDEMVGFCSFAIMNCFWQEGKIAYAYSMIVEEKLRGKGIGKMIINEALSRAKSLGCKRLELDSAFHREGAHKFYESLGFEKRAYLFSYNLVL